MVGAASVTPIVEVESITLRRGPATLLKNVNWTIQSGEHWALLGANGSGKTTLLKVLSGYEWPSEGVVRVLGKTFGKCDLPKLRREIGWVSVSLEHRIPPHDPVERVVASGFDASIGLYRPLSSAEEERVSDAIDRMGLEALRHRPFGWLSQGERAKTLIARGLVSRPKLLILDEPCAGLDPVAREAFLDDLAGLAGALDAPTLLLVTHHIEEIGPWVQRILALRAGQVAAVGDMESVLNDEAMSRVFDASCRVIRDGSRRWLQIA